MPLDYIAMYRSYLVLAEAVAAETEAEFAQAVSRIALEGGRISFG